MSKWFESFFQGPAVEFWIRAIPEARTVADADFLERTLAAAPNGPARLLDIPCGHGRHAIELARRGHSVTGIDLSQEFLAAARARAEAAGVSIDLRPGDMRSLDLAPASFDGAYCFGNSFGYLDREETASFLRAVARALKPGAKLVIETSTVAESILPNFAARSWYRVGDILMLSERRYAAVDSRMDIDYTFIQGGKEETRATSSYVMCAAELRALLAGADFETVAMNAGVAGEPFQLGSPTGLVITAQKKGILTSDF